MGSASWCEPYCRYQDHNIDIADIVDTGVDNHEGTDINNSDEDAGEAGTRQSDRSWGQRMSFQHEDHRQRHGRQHCLPS